MGRTMKKSIHVEVVRSGLFMDTNLTYAQVPGWSEFSTKDLKLSVIFHYGQEKLLPAIVWICGGSWCHVDHNIHLPNLVDLARQGYVIVSVNYRNSNEVKFPGQLEDIKAAIRYIRANACKYQIDVNHIGVMGESAGGHLAGLAGTTSGSSEFDLGANTEHSSDVQAACCWYMPADLHLTEEESHYRSEFEGGSSAVTQLLGKNAKDYPELANRANPMNYVTDHTPPFLLLHGENDGLVTMRQSELMYDALVQKGVPAELYIVEQAGHADLKFFQPDIMNLVIGFFNRILKNS